MKKVFAVLLVVLLSVSALYAGLGDSYKGSSDKGSLAVGLNLGTNAGVVVNYGMGDFDLEGIVGFGLLNGALDVEAAANYEILDLAKDLKIKGSMPLTIGGEVGLWAKLSDPFLMGINALVPVKLTYTFPKFPMSLYMRVAPGVGIQLVDAVKFSFGIQGSLGATYNF